MIGNFKLVEAAMRHRKIMFLLTFLLTLTGIWGLWKMPKQEFPPFTIRQGVIVGVYPGASSNEVEEQLAKPLERFLFTYKEIKRNKTYSISKNGMVYVMVELNDNIHNKDEVWSKIKHGLTMFKTQLPSGVLALIANDDFGDTSALLIAVESEDKTYRELEGYLDQLEDKLRRIESVSNLRRYGLQKEQIAIYLDKEKLATYGISDKLLMANLFSQGITTTGGTVKNESIDVPIHFTASYGSENELAEQVIYSDPSGNIVRLRDIARIEREYDEPDSYITQNGKRCIILSMEMREGFNIVEYGQQVDEVLKSFEKELPKSVSISRIADQPKVVDESVTSFVRDLFIAIIIVIAVMMILFPFKSAVVAATSIPISIFISIAIMYTVGIPLNTVTLAALIVVLGMIVDNSIIVIDVYLEKLDKGISRWNAAVHSAKDFFWSILLATLCISMIFFPLLFTMTGQFLDFLQFFPWTITISLMVSLIVAMLFIPFVEFAIIKKGLRGTNPTEKKKGFNLLDLVQNGYESMLRWTFRNPRITLIGGLTAFVLSVWLLSSLPMRMMPIADRDQFAVEIYLPQGSSLQQTAQVCDSVKNLLMKDNRVKSVTAFTGTSSPRFQTTYAPNFPAKNYAQLIVNTQSVAATNELLDRFTNAYADHFPNAYVKFKQLDYQVVNTPIEVRFSGDNIAELKQVADSLVRSIKQIPDLVWVHTNYEEQSPVIDVSLKPIEAARLGITKGIASAEMAMNYSGIPLGAIWEKDYPLTVKLKTDDRGETPSFGEVGNEYISTMIPGVSIPLRQVADVKAGWTDGSIVRRNGVRTISVMADVKRGYNQVAAFKKVKAMVEERIEPTMPKSIGVEYGGSDESDREAINPIIQGLIIAIIIIFFFLLISFKKISLALAALISLSFCLVGASVGVWISGEEFGLTCILGLISLMGIIVRNAIIMFDHAENLRKSKVHVKDAAFDAGKRRMMPIFLTSATTAVGVIPMIISQSSLWMPMGIVILAGTIISMIMVVTILPVAYWKIFDREK